MKYVRLLTREICDEPGPLSVRLDNHITSSPEVNTAIVPGTSFQFAWDSVSINLFKTCPRKYQLELLQGWVPKDTAPALLFGIFFHLCMESWHKLRAYGVEPEEALKSVTFLALALGDQLSSSNDTARTRQTLTRSVVWYLEQFKDDRTATVRLPSGAAAVELSFRMPLFVINGTEIDLCGHIDRLVSFMEDVFVTDYKTTKYALDSRFFDGFSPSTQMANYTIASQVAFEQPAAGLIIDGIQLGVNFARFQRHVLKFSPEQLDEYIKGLHEWISLAAHYADTGFYPMNEESCGKYSGCQFRPVCSQPPSIRIHYLKSKFIQRTWDPLKPR